MGVGKESPFVLFVHVGEEVCYSHLGGSIPNGRESQPHFFCWPLDPLRGEYVYYAC